MACLPPAFTDASVNTFVFFNDMTSDYSATLYQAHAIHLPSRAAITGSCWGKSVAAGAALCMAFFASPALAQEPSTYQGYLDQCLAQAKSSQESLRRGIDKRTAEGDAEKAQALTKRLAEHLANSAQKCETYSRQMADNDAKIAAADAKIAENNTRIAAADAKIAENRAETAEIRKINEGFQKFNAELPQMTREMEAVLAGKVTGGQRDAVIRKLEAFVVNGHSLIKQTRAVPSLQTPENIALLASFEKSVSNIQSSLRGTTR